MLSNIRITFYPNCQIRTARCCWPHLKPVELRHAKVLHRAGDIIERMYIPYDGVVSFVVGMSDGRFVEAGCLVETAWSAPGRPLMGRQPLSRLSFKREGQRWLSTLRL